MVANLAGRITDIDDSPYLLIIDGNDNPAGSIEDEDILHIRILTHRFKDIFHLILVFRQHGAFQNVIDHLCQMGADVFLEIGDHLFSMVEVLDDEEDGHGEGEQTNQSENDLKAEAFIKLNLSHRISCLSRLKKGKSGET